MALSKAKKGLIAALACTMVMSVGGAVLVGCGGEEKPTQSIHDDIVNGGFEEGNFTGWKASGDFAFDVDGVVTDDTVSGLDITVTGKVGEYYFNGLAAANATSTGTLESEPFKLGGLGKIGFKIGSGSDAAKCYVEFIEYGTNTVLKKVTNEAYEAGFIEDELVRVVVDLSEHLGKNIYIKVTDSGSTQRSHEYLHLDDFVVYKETADVDAATQERANLIKMYGRPIFENDTPTAKTIKNGNFEDGLNNWQVSGEAFSPKSIKASSELFWGTREYNAEGTYFVDGFNNGEDKGGSIRSTTFTLAETGIISFLLSSTPHDSIYVAVCNDEQIGDVAIGTELFKVKSSDVFKDNELSENMLRRYINASKYTPAGGTETSLIGKKLYIKLVDGREGANFGAACFDDVRCSMTSAEVQALEIADYRWALALTERGSEEIRYTQNYYNNLNYPIGLPLLRIIEAANSVAVKASTTALDLTKYLENVKAAYGDKQKEDFTYTITKVEYGSRTITSGFDSVVLDEAGLAKVTYEASITDPDETLERTFYIDVTTQNQISNGGFETGDFAGWSVTSGNVNLATGISGAEYGWSGASYNQGGNYHFDGVGTAAESELYKVRSGEFVLGGAGVISFKLGGRAATLRVYDMASGACLAEYKNTAWNDNEHPHVEKGCRNLTMTSYFADISQYLGLTLFIELADTETTQWGVAHFDDIVTYYEGDTAEVLTTLTGKTDTVNYNCESVAGTTQIGWLKATNNITPQLVQITQKAAYVELDAGATLDLNTYLNDVEGAVIGVATPTITKSIVKVVEGETETTTGFDSFAVVLGKTYTVTYRLSYNDGTKVWTADATFTIKVVGENDITNSGFELGNLTGWTYVEGTASGQISGADAISSDETFWGERIPFNKEGEYFFNGWNANVTESNAYSLKSTTFKLGGSGFISFKMGGNAAVVKVFKADGTQIANYANTAFKDVTFPHVENGCRLATMTTFVADLSEYIGENIYIELHDTGAGAWGVAFFDDIVTNYATAPDVTEHTDDVTIYCEDSSGSNYKIAWVEAVNTLTANS